MPCSIPLAKRYRMERSLCGALPPTTLQSGFRLVPWHDRLLEAHAKVLHRAFAEDFDGRVFPCFRTLDGCLELMRAMRGLPSFCPGATWLLTAPEGCIGTVQGLMGEHRFGMLQNIGLASAYRGRGLGSALLCSAIGGFRRSGATRVNLEVTASNLPAMRLYEKFGFRCIRHVYKPTASSSEPETSATLVPIIRAGNDSGDAIENRR